MSQSDGATADYYTLPEGATELQDIISALDLNAQIGEIMRADRRNHARLLPLRPLPALAEAARHSEDSLLRDGRGKAACGGAGVWAVTDDQREFFEERAAILEFDDGMTREEAERAALLELETAEFEQGQTNG